MSESKKHEIWSVVWFLGTLFVFLQIVLIFLSINTLQKVYKLEEDYSHKNWEMESKPITPSKIQLGKHHKFLATGYTSSKEECGNDKGITATGVKATRNQTVAVSREYAHWLGKRVLIYDEDTIYGIYVIEDLTSGKKKRMLDIYFGDSSYKEKALEFGVKKVKVIII